MRKFGVAAVSLLILAVIAIGYFTIGKMPANAKDISNKIFVINRGDSIRQIGNNLKREGLIRDPVVFFIYVKINNQDKNIQAGDFRLSPSMSLAKVIDNINHGTLDIWVTVPEGVRAQEIADIFEKSLPSYRDDWREKLATQEGYLFPDTYLIPR